MKAEAGGFSYERRVGFCDTDAMTVVHHANYLKYCEEARVAWLRAKGLSGSHYPQADRVMALIHYQMWHFRPAFFDDLLTIKLQVRAMGLKIHFQYAIYKGTEKIAQAETSHIPVDRALKPTRPSLEMSKQLEKEPWIETWLSNSSESQKRRP